MSAFTPSGRVAVTGIGGLTPLGNTIAEWWPRMLAGEGAIREIDTWDVSEYPTRIAGLLSGFDAEQYLDRKIARRIDPFLTYAVAASDMALADSGLEPDDELKGQIGVLIGSGIGGLQTMSDQTKKLWESGPGRVSPFLVPYMIPDMASGYVSIRHGFRGPNSCVVTACSTGANAIGDAAELIKRGAAPVMVAGGAEAPVTPIALAGFGAARAMSTRNDEPGKASRPFDLGRDGFVMGEGAGVLILEDWDFAVQRGARILAEVKGYGMSGDAHHITDPDPDGWGATASMTRALEHAGMEPQDIDYINAHGTSTPKNDSTETRAIRKVFGEHADSIPVSSTKSSIGHLLGAAGAVESVICVQALQDQKAPPTVNLDEPDPECDLDYIPHKGRECDLRAVMTNSFGFGGHNVTLIISKV